MTSVLSDDDDDGADGVYRGCYAYNPDNMWWSRKATFTYSKMTPDYCKGFCKFELPVSNSISNNNDSNLPCQFLFIVCIIKLFYKYNKIIAL